jgi:hypothetical protein
VLSDRYEDDPMFRAVVDAITRGGFADDDGVRHAGPTRADAALAEKALDAVPVGYVRTVNGWHRLDIDSLADDAIESYVAEHIGGDAR